MKSLLQHQDRFDLLGIGECLVEFTAMADGTYRQSYAGDVLNALSAASRLGLSTQLLSALGDDPFTPGLQRVLQEEGIGSGECPILPGAPNGVYFVHLGDKGKPGFHFLRSTSAARETFLVRDAAEWTALSARARAVLFSSIPLAVMKHRERLLQLIQCASKSSSVFYDLNVRPSLWSDVEELRSLLPQVAPFVDHLLVTDDDHRALFGEESPQATLDRYSALGFAEVVLRRGALPTLCKSCRTTGPIASPTTYTVPTVPTTRVVDTTGAGDAFNAGYIFAHLHGYAPYDALVFANATAASSIRHVGGRGIVKQEVEQLFREQVLKKSEE